MSCGASRAHRPLVRGIVIVSPAILFFLWMASLSLKFEVDNAAYPPVFIPEHFAWRTIATSSAPTASCLSLNSLS